MDLIEELKRRNVIRVGTAYVVASWLIIQVAETLFPIYGLPDSAVRVVVTIMAVGLLPALVFAWVYQRTSEGLKRDKDIDRSVESLPSTGKMLDRLIIIALAIALSYFVADKFLFDAPKTNGGFVISNPPGSDSSDAQSVSQSIAVLPFTNMSGDPANEPFTLGIHDDLLTHLSRISALRTVSRTSMLQYKNTIKSIPEIAEELQVDNILEGGIQRSGDRVRINLQLIDAETDQHLWAEIYDRELTAENLFAVQADVATQVASALQATLLPTEQSALEDAPTRIMAAYDLYLLGRYHLDLRTVESVEKARAYLEQALVEDPDYVLALAGLAEALAILVVLDAVTDSEAFARADAVIERAMQLDDDKSEVWAARGLLDWLKAEYEEAASALETALELDDKNYLAWMWYGNVLRVQRRFQEQLKAYQNAYALEPMSPPVMTNLASSFALRGDEDRARQLYERLDTLDVNREDNRGADIAWTAYWSGKLAESIELARREVAEDPRDGDSLNLLIRAYVDLGDLNEAQRWANEGNRVDARLPMALSIYLARGDTDGALVYLEDLRLQLQETVNWQFAQMQFEAAYSGRYIETAQSSLDQVIDFRGGRIEVNPAATRPEQTLAITTFLVRENTPGSAGWSQGKKALGELGDSLDALIAQDFNHAQTWFIRAAVNALSGEEEAALTALETAVAMGFRSTYQFKNHPALDDLRSLPRFIALGEELDRLLQEEREKLAGIELVPFTPLATAEPVRLSRATLERYAGYYTEGEFVVEVTLNDEGGLTARPGQLRPLNIVALSETELFAEESPAITMKAILDDSGELSHFMINLGGEAYRYRPMDAPPEPIELPVQALEEFVGTYVTQRITGTKDGIAETDLWTARFSIDDAGLPILELEGRDPLKIKPYSQSGFFPPGFLMDIQFVVDGSSQKPQAMIIQFETAKFEFDRQ